MDNIRVWRPRKSLTISIFLSNNPDMFVRVKRNVSKGIAYEYLQIVRSYREGGKVKQQIIGSLGRRDKLVTSGELDRLLRSLAGFSDKLRVVESSRESGRAARTAKQ